MPTPTMDFEDGLEILSNPILECEKYSFKVLKMTDTKYTVHLDVFDWSPSTLKEMKSIWPYILECFYQNGIDSLYSIVSEGNTHSERFCVMFGMAPINSYDLTFDDGRVKRINIFKIPTNIEEFA